MTTIIERLCNCDRAHALHLTRMAQLWLAYIGLLCFGGLLFGVPIAYITRQSYEAEAQRQHTEQIKLMEIITTRLPEVVKQTENAAKTLDTASATLLDAAGATNENTATVKAAAKSASSAAKSASKAANTTSDVAQDLNQALRALPAQPAPAPKKRKSVPEWLNTP